MSDVIIYHLLRVIFLVVGVAGMWVIAGTSLLSTIAGVVIAGLASFLLLGRQRRAANDVLEARRQAMADRRSRRTDSDEALEDASLEEEPTDQKGEQPGSEGESEGEQR